MDLAYADDAAIFLPNEGQAASTLADFSEAAAPFGLKVSWAKTKLQNLKYSPQSSDITIAGSIVEGVEELLYLGSRQTFDGRSLPDVMMHRPYWFSLGSREFPEEDLESLVPA